MSNFNDRSWRYFATAAIGVVALVTLFGCRSNAEIRVLNNSSHEFTDFQIAGQDFGDISPGEMSEYKVVDLSFNYASLQLKADGQYVTAQTLNMGSDKFTYEIDALDLAKGRLDIEVIKE